MPGLPVVGKVDWKWFLIGIAFVWFILPLLQGLLHRKAKDAA